MRKEATTLLLCTMYAHLWKVMLAPKLMNVKLFSQLNSAALPNLWPSFTAREWSPQLRQTWDYVLLASLPDQAPVVAIAA